MKKPLKFIVWLLVATLAGLLLALLFAGGPVIKGAVNTLGPAVLGVPVTLQGASFHPIQGRVRLTRLRVGNPEGFKTPALFEVGDITIELDSASLFTDTIMIREVVIEGPEITYERGLRNSNFGKLSDRLSGNSGDAGTKQTTKPESGRSRKCIIERLVVRDPKLRLSVTALGGHALPIALGQVELKEIGKESGGVTMTDAIRIIFSVITSNVENAITGTGSLIGSGASSVGHATTSAAKAVGSLIGLAPRSTNEPAATTGSNGATNNP